MINLFEKQLNNIEYGWNIWSRIKKSLDNDCSVFLFVNDSILKEACKAVKTFINNKNIETFYFFSSFDAVDYVNEFFKMNANVLSNEEIYALITYYKVHNFDWNFYPFINELLYSTYTRKKEEFSDYDICLYGILRVPSNSIDWVNNNVNQK